MGQQTLRQQVSGSKPVGSSRLRLGITDFGPVSKGTLDLKPLTVLVGPNGCGKSHVATLIHSIINAVYEKIATPLTPHLKDPFGVKAIEAEADRIDKEHQAGADSVESDIYEAYIKHKFQVLCDTLSVNFSGEHTELIRVGKKRFDLEVESVLINGKIYCADAIGVSLANKTRLKINFKDVDLHEPDMPNALRKDGDTLILNIPHFSREIANTNIFILDNNLLYFFRHIRKPLHRCIYFPAERGGLTLAYKSITLHFYNSFGMTNANPMDAELTNVSTHFLGLHLMPTGNKTEFAPLVENFEESALHGSVITQKNATKSLSLVFKKNNLILPLSRSASSVKDLAIFLLYLKHVAKKEETIILEEPETTLHPDNQILLARLIAKLINAGLRIVVTTHSPYFLEQLSHCVVAGSSQAGKEFREFADDERLDKDSVAAYSFKEDDGGYKMVPITVDDEGIPQHEFVDTSERQYNELLKLEQD